jgi:tetratricopeptide (TPR) repeat protein
MNKELDTLADESFLRWSDARLVNRNNKDFEVARCYSGESQQTLDFFKKNYLKKEEMPYYWLHIGNCFFSKNEWLKSEFYYRLALEDSKEPKIKSIALNNLGLIHFQFAQWEKGKEFIQKSIDMSPGFKVPRFNLAQLFLQFGLFEKAIECLSHPLFARTKDVDLYFSFANAYLFKGDLKKAGHYFSLIPPNNLKREDIAATYALYLLRVGDFEKASFVMNERKRSGIPELTAIAQKIEKLMLKRVTKD